MTLQGPLLVSQLSQYSLDFEDQISLYSDLREWSMPTDVERIAYSDIGGRKAWLKANPKIVDLCTEPKLTTALHLPSATLRRFFARRWVIKNEIR
jgi:hypothetical protein